MKISLLKGFEVWLNKRYRMNTVRGIISSTERFIHWCDSENIQAEKRPITNY